MASQLGPISEPLVVPMSTQVYVGLAVTAHNTGLVDGATFDQVGVTSAITSGYVAIDAGGGPSERSRSMQM